MALFYTDVPNLTAVDHEGIVVSTALKNLTAAKVTVNPSSSTDTPDMSFLDKKRADAVLVTVEAQNIRARWDLNAAALTNATGHLFNTGDSFVLYGYTNIQNLTMIRDTADAADATVRVTYYRRNV